MLINWGYAQKLAKEARFPSNPSPRALVEAEAEAGWQMLHDKQAQGQPLTEKQRGYFGAVAGGVAKKAEEPDGKVRERALEANAQQVTKGDSEECMNPIDAVKADMWAASQTAGMAKAFPMKSPRPPMPPQPGQKVSPPKPLDPQQPAQLVQPMPPVQPVQAAQAAQPAKPAQPQQPGQMGQFGQMTQQPAHPPTSGMPQQQLPGGTAGMPKPPKPQGSAIPGMPAIMPMGVHGGAKPAGVSTEDATNERFNDTREFVGKYANTPPKDHWNMIDALREQGHEHLANAHEALMRHKTDGDLEHLHKVTNHLREHYYGDGKDQKPTGDLTGEIEDRKVPQVRGNEQQGEIGEEAEKKPQVTQNVQPHSDEHKPEYEHEGVAQPVKGTSQPGQNDHEGPGGKQKMAPRQVTKAPVAHGQGEVGDGSLTYPDGSKATVEDVDAIVKKSLTSGISEMQDYLSKNMEASMLRKAEQPQAMPTGNAEFPQADANGGEGMEETGTMKQVKKAGEPKIDYDETYGDAPEAEEEALSEDDAEDEDQMKPHKKPIEESTEKSLTPARQRELAAKRQAAKVSQIRKSKDIVLHPYTEASMNAGLEDTIERRLNKADHQYVEDPSLVPGLPLISQGVLCKSCKHKHTAAVTACPYCGSGTTVSQVLPGIAVNGPMGVMEKSVVPILRPAKKQGDLHFDGGVIPAKE